MSFSEWSNNKRKKKGVSGSNGTSFSKWSNAKNGITEDEEGSALAWRNDEIAPVANTNPTWFQKGAFDNGYQFGDITKTVVGTVADINENINTAVFDATENLIDTVAYGVGAVGGLFNEDFKDDVGDFIAKEILKPTQTGEAIASYATPFGWVNHLVNGGETEENSVLGDKADGLVQSGAHLVGSYALQMAGVPAWLTMGVNAFGSEIESAFQNDATYTEAGKSGAISAAAEVVFERISSGIKFGKGGTLDEGIQNFLKNNIKNKVGRSLLKYGVDTAGEGLEEVATEFASALGRQFTYMDDKEFNEIISSEDLFDAFIGGVVMGGVAGGGRLANSAKTGRDYVTGLNSNEEKVVNKLYEDAIAEKEKGGTKLTTREKNKLYDEIVEQMDKGGIEIDTIEEVLGGKTYEDYKSAVENENALQKEFDTLNKMKQSDMSGEQIDRRAELKEQLSAIKEKGEQEFLKTKLSDDAFELSRGSRLEESYRERARKGEAFTADLTKYKGKQLDAVKRAVESGVLNNTRKAHALVDTLSRIEADKGIVFDYANNEKLKESGFAVEGKTVNGFANKSKGSVTLNIQSAKAWQTVVGHEITHILEGTDSYKDLQKALFEYAESRGELESRRTALTSLYENMDADIDSELTADLVGDYLFSDKNFIRSLTTDRNLFQKIYDEIKYLCKVATGKELTEIEKVRQEFDKVWKEFSTDGINEALSEGGKVKYSLSTEGMTESDIESAQKVIKTLKTSALSSKHLDGYATYTENRMERELNYSSSVSSPDYARSYITWVNPTNFIYATTTNEQMRTRLKEEAGELNVEKLQDEAQPIFLVVDFETGKIVGHEGRHRMLALRNKGVDNVAVIIDARNDDRYNTKPIQILAAKGQDFGKNQRGTDFYLHNLLPLSQRYADTARELFTNKPKSGVQYSVSPETDTEYMSAVERGDTETAQLMVDEAAKKAGYTRTLYHGTASNFNVFGFGRTGIFTTDNYDMAKTYGNNVISLYGKEGAKVLTIDAQESPHYAIRVDKNILDFSEYPLIGAKETYSTNDISLIAFREGYDVVVIKNVYDNYNAASGNKNGLGTDVVYKDSNQVKSSEAITYDDNGNVIPLSQRFSPENEDIRYSVSEDSEGNQLTVEQQKKFENSKVRDANGNLIPLYHGSRNEAFSVFDMEKGVWLATDQRYSEVYADKWHSWRDDDPDLAYTRTDLNGLEPEVYADPDYRVYKVYADIQNPLDVGEIDGYLSDGKVGALARALGVKYSELKAISDNYMEEPTYMLTRSEEFIDLAHSMGFDGLKATEKGRETWCVIQSADQIKLTTNQTPTADPDIRFSLSKSVEETKDLVALHNLNTNKLNKVIDLGGFPMPSIAVTRTDIPHTNFGDITLVMNKSTIDPKANRKNTVYSADAWTPTVPRTEYKPNDSRLREISNKVYDLIGDRNIANALDYVAFDADNVSRDLENNDGNLTNKYLNNNTLKYAFLKDIGANIDMPMTDAKLQRGVSNEAVRYFSGKLVNGLRTVEHYQNMSATEVMNDKELTNAVAEVLNWDVLRSFEEGTENYEKLKAKPLYKAEDLSFSEINNLLSGARAYFNHGIKQTIDSREAKNTINNYFSENDLQGQYETWLNELFGGVVEKRGIYNNKDIFTPSGNRRTFEQLHLPVTLDNLVKAMASQNDGNTKNVAGFNGVKTLRAGTAERFKSIDDMHKLEGRLQHLTEKEFEAIHDQLSDRMYKVINSILETSPETGGNIYMRMDSVGETLMEIAESGNYSTDAIIKTVNQYIYNIDENIADEIRTLLYDVSQMPTNMFEAKPERAVGFDEVNAAILPDDADIALRERLEGMGVKVLTYEKGNDTDRLNKLNSLLDEQPDWKFSLSNEGEQFAPVGNYSTPLNETALAQESDIAPVQDVAETVESPMDEEIPMPTDADAPALENIAPLPDAELEQGTHAAIKPKPAKQPSLKKATETSEGGIIPNGTRVIAHDRNNIGVVQSYNEATGKYTVRFKSKEGFTAAVQLDAEAVTPVAKNSNAASDNAESSERIAQVLTEEPKVEKKKQNIISKAVSNFIDKGAVFENLSLKTKNRALQDTYKAIGRSETKAQYFMKNGTEGVKSLDSIREEVEKTGKTQEFYEYLYHKHNVDRMNLENKEKPNLQRLTGEMKKLKLLDLQENQLRAIASEKITKETNPKRVELIKTVREYLASKDVKNKPVFDFSVTAEMSQDIANKYEAENPKFKEYAQDVYNYMNHLRKMMVYNGVISQETAKLWAEMYPNYVPIRRVGHGGLSVDVPLDTNRTGVNAPVKRATGGNSDILPLFNTMAQRTSQTFKAIDKNKFGIELKDTLGGVTESTATNLDEIIDSIDTQDSLLQEGKNGKNPTFTVFENGERVTFDITEEMYDALKPTSEGLLYTNKVLNKASSLHRGVLTEYNPVFMATNAIKDAQDVLINSQHPSKTYANFPVAIKELATKGKWYTEYMENGGGDNTYFDKQTNTFNEEKSQLRKIIGFPLDKISEANNLIEKMPRLAEYIASRKKGASVEAAMLDAARVTTDFSAGGDVTKFLNRNGATFLNASVQGFSQQVRNVREAKANGLKGWLGLATKYAIAGLPAILLNGALWDDDEDYEELSDYVKENYYVVAKYGDGKFVRIPKGRALAVIQNGFEQVGNAITGDDEVDFGRFFELFLSNLAPNNPLDNNIIAPIKQVVENKTWYGEDLVPTRLQDLPAAEQYDESTDAISKWLGEKTNTSPYKINYLLNQYSGGIGDVFLPMLTPEAESGDNSLGGNIIAPIKDKFTTDSVMNNQNVSDFYNTVDELTANAKSSYATEEDVLKYKYVNSVNTELGDLYKAKREIQNSTLSDAEKYEQVREIQKQINTLAKESLETYESVSIEGDYATVGNRAYKKNDDDEWQKINDEQLQKQEVFTSGTSLSPSDYWEVKGGLSGITADKDGNGKSINGSRKEKVLEYINNLDADYYSKIILFKSEYPSDDTYNYEIINYLNNREDLTYDELVTIYTELGFTVQDGYVYWD